MIHLREYQESDQTKLISLIEKLQEHVASLDPIERVRKMPGYGQNTFNNATEFVKSRQGKIFVAEHDNKIVGYITGFINKQSQENLLEVIPTQLGIVVDLFVVDTHRSKSIGTLLMERMQEYFKQQGCDSVWVTVFVPNLLAHSFYKKLGFIDRELGMLKKI
jgi:GNAT superfamily N-acetyltransferase